MLSFPYWIRTKLRRVRAWEPRARCVVSLGSASLTYLALGPKLWFYSNSPILLMTCLITVTVFFISMRSWTLPIYVYKIFIVAGRADVVSSTQ